MADLRGNVDTRIRKLKEGQYAAIVLAQAGLDRLGFDAEIRQRLPLDVMLPAPGQAALGIEARADDTQAVASLQTIDDPPTHAAVIAERPARPRSKAAASPRLRPMPRSTAIRSCCKAAS